MALLDKVRNIASALGKTSWNPVRPGIQMLPPVKLQAPKLSGTARANLSSMGSNLVSAYKDWKSKPSNLIFKNPKSGLSNITSTGRYIMGGSIAKGGQMATDIAKTANYGQRQNQFMRTVVPAYLEASTQAPGALVGGLTHYIPQLNPLQGITRQYGTTKATNLLAGLYGFSAGPGKLYYSPVEKPVEQAVSGIFGKQAGKLLPRIVAGATAESVSSLAPSAIQATAESRKFKDVYPEQVGMGLGARGLIGGIGLGSKFLGKLLAGSSEGKIDFSKYIPNMDAKKLTSRVSTLGEQDVGLLESYVDNYRKHPKLAEDKTTRGTVNFLAKQIGIKDTGLDYKEFVSEIKKNIDLWYKLKQAGGFINPSAKVELPSKPLTKAQHDANISQSTLSDIKPESKSITDFLVESKTVDPEEIDLAYKAFKEISPDDKSFIDALTPKQKVVFAQLQTKQAQTSLDELKTTREAQVGELSVLSPELKKDIARIKQMMASKKYAGGDIETLRKANPGLVNKVTEGINEIFYPGETKLDTDLLAKALELPSVTRGIGEAKTTLKQAYEAEKEAKTGIFPEGYGTTGRFAKFPTGEAGKVEFKENVPFTEQGGRRIGKTFQEKFNILLEGNPRLKKKLGLFKHAEDMTGTMQEGKIQIKNMDDLQTLNHEVGHYIDIGLGRIFSGTKGKGGVLSGNKAFREELINLTKELSGDFDGAGKGYKQYRQSSKELIAEFVSAYQTNKELAQKLAPNFTKVFETGYANDEQIKFAVDQMGEWNASFKPIKDFVESLRTIPEIKTELDTVKETGNFAQNFWREKIGNKLWGAIEKLVDKTGKTTIGSYFVESRGLNKTVDTILTSRRRLIDGQIARIDEEIVAPLRKLSKEDSKAVAELMQKSKKTGELGGLAEQTSKEMAVWGNEARKLKLLNDESFWDNVGQYFPFMYSTKEFAENSSKFGSTKKLKADLSGYKKKLTDYEMGMKVLKNKLGSWPSSLKKISENYTPKQIEQIGRDTRKEMGLIETAAYPVKKRLDQMIQSVYTVKAMNKIAEVPGMVSNTRLDGFEKMPEAPSYGNLSGKYVPKNLFDELTAMTSKPSELGLAIQKINSIWKTMKVPYNPATVMRNIQSNILLSWLSDTPIYNPKVSGDGIKSFFTQDDTYKKLRDVGLYSSSYSKNELKELAFADGDGNLDKVFSWAIKTYNTPGKVYGAVESVFKTILAKDAMRRGYGVDEAVEYANKWLFDYGKVSKVTQGLRQTMTPFVTFTMKSFPRLIETIVRKPEKLIILGSILGGINATSRAKLGITEEEEKQQKPEYLGKTGSLTMLLPDRDKNGQLQFVDMNYINPWGGIVQQGSSGLPQGLEPGGVLPTLYNAYVSNYDPFFQQEIAASYLPKEEKAAEKAKYVGRAMLPSLAPGGYGYEKIRKAATGEGDYAGRVNTMQNALLSSVAGIKVIPGGEREVEKKTNKIERDIRDIKSEISMTYKNKGMNEQKKAETISKLESLINKKQQELSGKVTDFEQSIRYIDQNNNLQTVDLTKLQERTGATLGDTLANKERKSTITQLYKAYATGDITKEQLDSAYSKYGVDIKQAEYAVLDSLTTEEKAPFILEKLTSPQSTKQDLDDMVSTKLLTSTVVTEMEDKGMISENQAKVLKNYIKQKTYKSKAKKLKVFKPKISRLKLTSRRRGDTKKIRSGLTLKDLYKKR